MHGPGTEPNTQDSYGAKAHQIKTWPSFLAGSLGSLPGFPS
jgi:hypothetical protein